MLRFQNGSIRSSNNGTFYHTNTDGFCLRRYRATKSLELHLYDDDSSEERRSAMGGTSIASICKVAIWWWNSLKLKALSASDMLIAVPYLIIIFLFYTFAHELCCLHGKCVIAYVISVAIFHTSLAIVQLDDDKLRKIPFACRTAGYLLYTSIFVCFLWIITMCYDVWAGFR